MSSRNIFGWWWLTVIAAVMGVASLPGWYFGWLAILAVIPRIRYWEGAGNRRGDYLGGFVYWALSFTILLETAPLFPIGAGLLMGWIWVFEGVCYRRLRRVLPISLAAPLALFSVQFVVAKWFFGGVPWAGRALGFAENAIGLKIASVVGEFGLSFLIVVVAAWIFTIANQWRKGQTSWLNVAWQPALLIGLSSFSTPLSFPIEGGNIPFLAVQPNIALGAKTAAGGDAGIFDLHHQMAVDYLEAHPQWKPALLVWSETMYLLPTTLPATSGEIRLPRRGFPESPAVYDAGAVFELQANATTLAASVLQDGGLFLTGAHLYRGVDADEHQMTMSPRASEALVFNQNGDLLANRGKTELVPFGESLPFDGAFPGAKPIARFVFDNFGLSPDFLRAELMEPLSLNLPTPGAVVLGTAICWENAFDHVFRRQAQEGAECFIVLSNEAWYGVGAEMLQMIASTRFRAAETGRFIARATNTGISAVVSPDGQILSQIPAGEAQVLAAELPRVPSSTQTSYLSWGWFFGHFLLIGCLIGLIFGRNPPLGDISA